MAVSLDAPAKLNLHLGIYAELDERRYHRADSLMVSLDACDRVRVSLCEQGEAPIVTCVPELDIPQEKNTCYRAAKLLAELVGRSPAVRVEIEKHLPDQAGLGGSSSDAAATLRALCALWGIPEDDERVTRAARLTGADVPFFLDGCPTLLVGAGDVVAERFPRPRDPIPVVLVRPSGPGVSTPVAYAAFDEGHEEPRDPSALCALLREGHASGRELAPLLANNLDPIACALLPQVGEIRSWLLGQRGVYGGQVTGSGSCVFALTTDDEASEAIAARAQEKFGCWARSCHIV